MHLRGELDLAEEAHNTEVVGQVIADFPELLVAKVIHPHVTEKVLVLERIHGKKVTTDHRLPREDAERLAQQFFRAYVRQVTVEGVYHADPHRGNVLLTSDGRLAVLDFGLLGRLDDETRSTVALLLVAIARNRADDVASLLLALSLTTLDSDEAGFVHELRRKLPRYHWRPLARIRARDWDAEGGSRPFRAWRPRACAAVGRQPNRRGDHRRRATALVGADRPRARPAVARFAGVCLASVLGLYMVWKIIRTPGEL